MSSFLNADTLIYNDDEKSQQCAVQITDVPTSKKPKARGSELLNEEETCALTSWVLQGDFGCIERRDSRDLNHVSFR